VFYRISRPFISSRAPSWREGREVRVPSQYGRNFFLFFQVYTWNPKLESAIRYFVNNVMRPSDNLTVVTSANLYRLKKEWLAKSSKEETADRLAEIVRRDTLVGNTEYRSILEELKRMMTGGAWTGPGKPNRTLSSSAKDRGASSS